MSTTVFRCLLFLSLAIAHVSGYAASTHEQEQEQEQEQLSLVQQQLDTLERLATRAEAARTLEPIERYRFDYPRLTQDIQRIRQGVQSYLYPSRAQPRDPSELVGDYRLDTPIAEPSP
ncbi:conjugal transfer protein [Pseudomonas marginalis]|uniref:Conjugal transfer protein n=1 Tax=Pseudomonas marginalis TaxID=298 RepID=A0A9X9BQM0_PSEMA|nr:RAQPRD family integrative conjugative element protein [Pseudomonas marginalis]TWR54722.1 conjugal transfer protein [Pseudomonas marginalis]SEB46843.1 integrative conjugative element protein, RAQPRD family [Pseudomonas marginalis]